MLNISSIKICELKEIIKDDNKLDEDMLLALADDTRPGVQKIYNKLMNDRNKKIRELERLKEIHKYEESCCFKGYKLIAGVDEAGRGPLAGPVAAGAVILPDDIEICGVNDSKQLSNKKRKQLAGQIKEAALCWSIGLATEEEIEKLNIRNATHLAMARAVNKLKIKPDILLVDGFLIPDLEIEQQAIVGGDGKSVSIAAASILAKVERDRIMDKYHATYPEYGFDKHKGYGTKQHFEAIMRYGPCPIHRKDFEPVKSFIANRNSLFKDWF
ncbi:ribonuclease HII [Desulfoscipio sp. XC116]|uniref:ribonuclease HII n=1 Tax=Desulfoscipio sp. XC116 TaxID=3144975 RepID=UPI00325BD559